MNMAKANIVALKGWLDLSSIK